jgi:hypothetical protein
MRKPWWEKVLLLFVAFAIVGSVKMIYREWAYEKKIPIESTSHEWQVVGPSTMMFQGQSYPGDVYFDRLSLEKKENKITLWVKVTTHKPVVMRKPNDTYTWDEQITRLTVDCGFKDIKMDYISLYLQGKKQHGGKIDDLDLPIVKGTTGHVIYESFCF